MFKENVKHAAKLYLRTYLAAVMGAFTYLSIGVLMSMTAKEGQPVSNASSLLMNSIALVLEGALFYLIVYSKLWELGDRNSNAVRFGHMNPDRLRGFKIGLLASIPSFLSFVALLADKLFHFWDSMAAIYRICQLALYPIVVWSMGSTVTVTTADVSWGGILCAGLPVLFVPVVAGIAYLLGYHNIQVWEKLVFVKKRK